MERIIRRLAQLVSSGAGTRARSQQVDVSAAPASVRALVDALAKHDYNIQLGEFSMYAVGEDSSLRSLAGTLELSCQDSDIDLDVLKQTGGPGGGPFDPEQTLELGADGGGMSYFGVSWSGGKLAFVVVELEDPTEDNVLRFFTTPEELFAFLRHANRHEEGSLPHLDALEAAAGIAPSPTSAAAPATAGFVPMPGPTLAHQVRIHPYRDGNPGEAVATLPVTGFNIFVGHGRVFFKTSQPVAGMSVASWNGRELAPEGVFPVDAKVFSLHAAVEQDGKTLVAFVDTNGKAHWLAYAG